MSVSQPKIEWVHIGSVSVDTGSLALIDPCAADAVVAARAAHVATGKFPTGPTPVDSRHGAEGYGLIVAGFGGDGTFDVYARYEVSPLVPGSKPVIKQVMIDFAGFYRRLLRQMKADGTTPRQWFGDDAEGGA